MANPTYEGREQTAVKHFILYRYLEKFAIIVGKGYRSITYVDAFAGPWKQSASDLSDTSFSLALGRLQLARQIHRDQFGRDLRIRCVFVERDSEAFTKLQAFASVIDPADAEIKTLKGELESNLDDVLAFVRDGGPSTFPFFFIDPTGWTGFKMEVIEPLLRTRPGEVLINFMTSHIERFIEHEPNRRGFEELFGDASFDQRLSSLSGQDREDAIVATYCENLRTRGEFEFACPAMVLEPLRGRTYFHLVYATRHSRGIRVFREVERAAMAEMEKLRATARRKQEERQRGGPGLWGDELPPEDLGYQRLRDRYLSQARADIVELLRPGIVIDYDKLCMIMIARQTPMAWETDLREWLKDWRRQGVIRYRGLNSRQQPKFGEGHQIECLKVVP